LETDACFAGENRFMRHEGNMSADQTLLWKPDWAEARQALTAWWKHEGLALSISAKRNHPWAQLPAPPLRGDPCTWWYDVPGWLAHSLYGMAGTYFGGVAFPSINTNIGGPGSLGLFLGAVGHPARDTLWYAPCITDPDAHPPLRFDPTCRWWQLHVALLEQAQIQSQGRYVVGFPDLVENIDTLAQLRNPQDLLIDLFERPDWVKARVAEINVAYFEAYDRMWRLQQDPWGGSTFCAFQLWAPGRVAKVQCDFSCMISPAMYQDFVVPALTGQCAKLDYSMYHLDGTQAMQHVDALLAIDELDAIEWTPQAGIEGGGSPRWYDLYRRIKAAGKSVQAVGVKLEEIEPLLEAVGPEGMYVMCWGCKEDEARAVLRRCGWHGDV